MKPVLSIVIANFNYGRFLEEAIESVISQGMGDKVELIVCDAASTDNSVEIIKKYANGLPPNTFYVDWVSQNNAQRTTRNSQLLTWWCSEKDGGQSAAFNKGFSHARGEWFTWLNADDLYFPGALKAFFELVERNPTAEWITGNKMHFDSLTGNIISVNWGPHRMPPFLNKNHASSGSFGPTAFWRRGVYDRVGPIDERMHYAMDTEYWARMTMAGIRQTRLRHFCWAFREHEDSKTEGVQPTSVLEKRAAETKYWREKTGYTYKHDFSNPWYWLLMVWRFCDGSILKRLYLKRRYEGKLLEFAIQNCKECQ